MPDLHSISLQSVTFQTRTCKRPFPSSQAEGVQWIPITNSGQLQLEHYPDELLCL
eukprot:Gb_29469 [translate_table: standard]